MLKKFGTILVFIAILLQGVFLPLLPQKAEAQTPIITVVDQGVAKVESLGKYKWTFSITVTGVTLNPQSDVEIYITKNPGGSSSEVIVDSETFVINNNSGVYTSTPILEEGNTYSAYALKNSTSGANASVTSNSILTTIAAGGDVTTAPGSTGGLTQPSGSNKSQTLPICVDFPSVYIAGCVSQLIYYAVFIPASFLFSLTGQLLDWAMGYTIDSNSYTGGGATFVEKGWKITRDLANIFFIFVLIYTAIGLILDLHSVNPKKTIVMVVVIALLLNFSLFFTKIIIDASNILGGIFYNNIGVTSEDVNQVPNPWINEGTKNISIAIVSKFNPQKIFQETNKFSVNTPAGVEDLNQGGKGPPPLQFGIISLIMAIISLVGAWVFFVVGFLFIGRVVMLWLLMIFAPIAFISYILPEGSKKMLGQMHHSVWWDTLIKQAFVVPIFLFFLYLILSFLNTNFYNAASSNFTSTQSILGVIIPFLLISVLLIKAKKIATDMSGELGGAMTKIATFAGGAAVGMATGGAALLGRSTVGRVANRISNSDTIRDMASGKGGRLSQLTGSMIFKGSSAVAKSSFDARNTGAANLASSQTGLNFNNKATSFVGLDTKATAGGWQGKEERKIAKEQAFAKSLGYDHHAYEHEGEAIDAQEDRVRAQEEIKRRISNQIDAAKEMPERNPDEKETKRLELNRLKANRNRVDDNIKALNKGGTFTPVTANGEINAEQAIENINVGIEKAKKNQERIKTAREKEYFAGKRRDSGKAYEEDTRDELGNIKKFGKEISPEEREARRTTRNQVYQRVENLRGQRAEAQTTMSNSAAAYLAAQQQNNQEQTRAAEAAYQATQAAVRRIEDDLTKAQREYTIANQNFIRAEGAGLKKAGKQLVTEFLKGAAKGVAPGMVIGSFVPGIGTFVGAAGGGLLSGLREAFAEYSGTTNRHMADAHAPAGKHKSSYKEPSPQADHHDTSHDDGGHGGDDHGGGDHGGGGHH